MPGVEIIANGSGSHHELRKLDTRIALIRNASAKNGGIYLYANQQGCDGGRLYFDGCALIAQNGEILAQGSQFSLKDVEVVTATVNLDDVRAYRGTKASRAVQASKMEPLPQIDIDFDFEPAHGNSVLNVSTKIEPSMHEPEEEIALGPGVLALGLSTQVWCGGVFHSAFWRC